MSNVRDAVEQFIQLARLEREAVYAAWKADRYDKALSARIEDWHANRGEYRDGGFFPCTGTARLIETLTPRNGCGAFDKAFQWACEAVRATPAANSDLAKLEAVHKAHHDLIEAYRKAAENPGGLQPTEDEHAEAVNALALTFGLYMPATANRNVDASNPFVQIASHAATLADMYPVIRAEIIRLSELCETEGGRGMFSDELKLNAKKWDELERNRRMLFALLVKHMPNQAKELREICKSGRWTAHDKSLDLEPALAELRGIVVDACRLIGTSADPHAQPTQQTQPIGESSFGRGKLPAGDATQADGPKLPLRVEKVRDQYEQACELSHTDKLNNRAAYNLLEKANAEAKARKQPLPYPALDPFDNWCRYLREWRHATGQQRNKPRRGRTLAKQSG